MSGPEDRYASGMTTQKSSLPNLAWELSLFENRRRLAIEQMNDPRFLARLLLDDEDSSEQQQNPQPPKDNDGSQRDPDELIKSWRREDGPDQEER
jgi:hypothetical protein